QWFVRYAGGRPSGVLPAEPRRDALDRLDAVGARAESGDPKVALPARPETRPGHAHYLGLGQQPVEEVPRRYAGRRADPDVRSVASTVHGEPGPSQAFADDARVVHVLVDQRSDLLLALRSVDGRRRPLDDVRRPIRLGRLSPEPELVEADLLSGRGPPLSLARDDGVGHAQASEACVLREAARLDGHFPCSLD